MAQRTENFNKLPESLRNFFNYLIPFGIIKKIVLFGSRARNNARDNSDYDFAIWVTDRKRWTKISLEAEEKNFTLLPIDLVIYDEVSAEYKKNIDHEGIVIYG